MNQVDGTSSLRESPITPGSTPVLRRTTSRAVSVTADDLDDLLTEGKAAADAANVNKESNYSNSDISKPQQHFKTPNQQIRSPISTPATSTKVQKQIVDFNRNDSKPTGKPSSKPENVESSDASEGEILEKPKPILKPKTTQPPSGAKETQTIIGKSVKEQVVRNPRDAQAGQTSRDSDSGGTSPRRRGSLQHSGPSLSRNRDNRQQSVEGKIDKKAYGTSYKYEPSNQPETGQIQYQRRDPLETSGEPRKYEIKYESRGEDSPSKSNVPTLTDLLFVDADLREWLAITRYHDTEYRNKTLNRRRAIAALDAQKAKLLEEMERDERGVAANVSQGTLAAMLPPPAPSHPLTAVAKEKAALLPENTERPVSRPVKQEAGNKRTYSDYQSPRADGGAEKIGRLDELGRGIRSRSENGAEDRRPYSSGYDGSRRRSPPIESNPSRREDIDYYRHQSEERGSGRGRGRGRGYDRESSPGLQAVHGRPPVRSFSPGQDDYRDRGEGKHSRPYVVRGNYRGRDYDPNYRGRGRGRGSWGNSNEIDSRQPYEQGHSDSHRIVNGKPSKDSKVWDKGGKGGQ